MKASDRQNTNGSARHAILICMITFLIAATSSVLWVQRKADKERDALTAQIEGLQNEKAQLAEKESELEKLLREFKNQESNVDHQNAAEIESLRKQLEEIHAANRTLVNDIEELRKQEEADQTETAINHVKNHLEENPFDSIPELTLLSDEQWRRIYSQSNLEDHDPIDLLPQLRTAAKETAAFEFRSALTGFLAENDNQLPGDLQSLTAYLPEDMDQTILDRYDILSPEETIRAYDQTEGAEMHLDSPYILERFDGSQTPPDTIHWIGAESSGTFSVRASQ